MKGVFSVVPDKIMKQSSQMEQIMAVLRENSESITGISNRLYIQNSAEKRVKTYLTEVASEAMKESEQVKKLQASLSTAMEKYKNTELKIAGNKVNNIKRGTIKAEPTRKDESPYDDEGSYGGNQSSPREHKEEMSSIVKKYYPDFTDSQIDDYLKKLESEGCGYVAICNTLFLQYIGKEEEFKRIFGFSMYTKDGDFNYDALVTDFYCATDNHNQKGILWWKHDSVNANEDISGTEGNGTSRNSREYRYEMYMKNHGINVDVKNVNVSARNFNSISQKGEIVVGIYPCVLYDSKGNKVVDIKGGHAMTVTGVTSDGMIIVSSWGKKYYIKPGSYSREQYQQVIYK